MSFDPLFRISLDDDINNYFSLPITYATNTSQIDENIVNTLELAHPVNINNDDNKEYKNVNSLNQSIYEHIFSSSNILGNQVVSMTPKHYTTDIDFLKQTQSMIQNINLTSNNSGNENDNITQLLEQWYANKLNEGFCDKYMYASFEPIKFINKHKITVQLMTAFNIASPLFALCIPIFGLLIPFFILKIKGIALTCNEYFAALSPIISSHAVCRIFTDFSSVDSGERIYILLAAAFYIFTVYQNIVACQKIYTNLGEICNIIQTLNLYLTNTFTHMDQFIQCTKNLPAYNEFNNTLLEHKSQLHMLHDQIIKIKPFDWSINSIKDIGEIMYIFYNLYDDEIINASMSYSFGFNGYIDSIKGIQTNINKKYLSKAVFKSDTKSSNNRQSNKNCIKFTKMYYPKWVGKDEKVRNNCNINKSAIISGPNASGKTTILKTALINLLVTQQTGFGCYDSLIVTPIDCFYCYLNIPDTSGRDSLFQAEARRCKEIMSNVITEYPHKRHFGIFDELFSGTNPEDAVNSAYAFMTHILRNQNMTCMLTTHYTKLCKRLQKNKFIYNYSMKTHYTDNKLYYDYILERGISSVRGTKSVLEDMEYPEEITHQLH